jgi:hypothetical protein
MATDSQEKFASAKVIASKAAAGTNNIGVRIAAMEELEKGMNLLEKIRGTIGEQTFSDGVNDIYKNLPKYSTSREDVQVIDFNKDGHTVSNLLLFSMLQRRIALLDSDDDSIPAPATMEDGVDVESGDDDSDDDDFTDGNGGID